MKTASPRPRSVARIASVALIGALAAVGLALPSSASAATHTISVDADDFERHVDAYSADEQTISRLSTTITVSLPDGIGDLEYDREFWGFDGKAGTVPTRQGSVSTLTVPKAVWTSRPVGSTFTITLHGGDDVGGNSYVATYTVKVGASGGGLSTLDSDGARVDARTSYDVAADRVTVQTGDTGVLDEEPRHRPRPRRHQDGGGVGRDLR
jgi:hypothetical protein